MKRHLFFMVCAFLLGCGGGDGEGERRSGPRERDRSDRARDRRGDLESEQARGDERARLKSGPVVIDSKLGKRYKGVGYGVKEYGGEDCGDFEDCREICDEITRNEKRCYRAPEDMVRDMENGLFTLIRISEAKSVDVGPALMRGILQIEKKLVLDLVKDQMSAGDLKSFLAWVAINEDIAEIIEDEDSSNQILEAAFKELGKFQEGAANNRGTGLNIGLIGREDTFFYLAADESNKAAFKMGYDILESICPDKSCKTRVLCARENQGRSRSRVFGRNAGAQCRTSSDNRRRSSYRRGACYLHGSSAWSYLYELLEESEIRDGDFKGELLGTEECNKYCGNSRSETCDAVF